MPPSHRNTGCLYRENASVAAEALLKRRPLPVAVIARSDSDAAIPMIVRPFQKVAASPSLLAMTE
jgi:hypothetical protein